MLLEFGALELKGFSVRNFFVYALGEPLFASRVWGPGVEGV